MPALRMRFELFPSELQFSRAFSRLGEYATDLRPAWENIVDDFIEGERKQFASEGRSGSGGWRPLTSRYARWKQRRYGNLPIGTRSRRLRNAAEGGSELQRRIEKRELVLRILTPYARFFHADRPVIELTAAQKRRWSKIVQAHLVEARNKAFAEIGV